MFKISITSILVLLISMTSLAETSVDPEEDKNVNTDAEIVKVSYMPSEILHLTETQIKNIENPDAIQIVYNTTAKKFYSYSYTIGLWIETRIVPSYSFSCGSPLLDQRDGQTYQTLAIGDQCWMAENLNVGTQIKGSQSQEDNSTIEKYCYDDSESNCASYGGLYQWNEAMDYNAKASSKGICPSGWHIPSDEEWKEMEKSIGMSSREADEFAWRGTNQGSELKGTINSVLWPSNTKSKYGFNALPGGYRYFDGNFNSIEINSSFWSSTEDGSDAINRYLFSNYEKEGRDYYDKSYGFSVRCVKDQITLLNSLQAILY